MNMKSRYRLFLRRKSVYYAFDDTTKTFTSLKTKDKAEAARLLVAMNEAGHQPAMNLSLARVYLRHSDPLVSTRPSRRPVEIRALPCAVIWCLTNFGTTPFRKCRRALVPASAWCRRQPIPAPARRD